MAVKVAINGFGRIGRLVARAILERPDCGLELVSVNDLADAKSNALLFKRDRVHGDFPDRKSVVKGKRVTARVDIGGRRNITKNSDRGLRLTLSLDRI